MFQSDNQAKRGYKPPINIPSSPPSIPSDETVRGWPGITTKGAEHHFSFLSFLLISPPREILSFFVRCFQFCPSPHTHNNLLQICNITKKNGVKTCYKFLLGSIYTLRFCN